MTTLAKPTQMKHSYNITISKYDKLKKENFKKSLEKLIMNLKVKNQSVIHNLNVFDNIVLK